MFVQILPLGPKMALLGGGGGQMFYIDFYNENVKNLLV